MGVVKTDDAARLLRFVYLGPASYRWPAASIPAYGTFFLLSLTLIGVTFWTRPNLGVWLLMELPIAIGGSLLVTRLIFRYIDAERGMDYQRRTLAAELTAPRPHRGGATTYSTSIPRELFTDHREGR